MLPASGSAPADAQLLHVPDADWLTFNRTLAGDRFSPLAQINTGNARHLQVKCIAQLGELGSFETSPIVYDGQMFVTTAHKVLALDAATCAAKWSYNYVPVDPEHLPGNRGVALYQGRVFRGTTDGHLIALDAASGKLLWDVRVADGALGYEITGAPVAFDGKVFTGDAGADTGIRGRIYAFDVSTGALVWAFDIIPRAGAAGSASWSGGTDKGAARPGPAWPSMRRITCCSCPLAIPHRISMMPAAVATTSTPIRWSRWIWARVACPGTCNRSRTTCMTGTLPPHRRCSHMAATA